MKTKSRMISVLPTVSFLLFLSTNLFATEYIVLSAVQMFSGDDFSDWEQVCEPRFGNEHNIAVIAMAEYQGRL
jgi:hypothetical protein